MRADDYWHGKVVELRKETETIQVCQTILTPTNIDTRFLGVGEGLVVLAERRSDGFRLWFESEQEASGPTVSVHAIITCQRFVYPISSRNLTEIGARELMQGDTWTVIDVDAFECESHIHIHSTLHWPDHLTLATVTVPHVDEKDILQAFVTPTRFFWRYKLKTKSKKVSLKVHMTFLHFCQTFITKEIKGQNKILHMRHLLQS